MSSFAIPQFLTKGRSGNLLSSPQFLGGTGFYWKSSCTHSAFITENLGFSHTQVITCLTKARTRSIWAIQIIKKNAGSSNSCALPAVQVESTLHCQMLDDWGWIEERHCIVLAKGQNKTFSSALGSTKQWQKYPNRKKSQFNKSCPVKTVGANS